MMSSADHDVVAGGAPGGGIKKLASCSFLPVCNAHDVSVGLERRIDPWQSVGDIDVPEPTNLECTVSIDSMTENCSNVITTDPCHFIRGAYILPIDCSLCYK